MKLLCLLGLLCVELADGVLMFLQDLLTGALCTELRLRLPGRSAGADGLQLAPDQISWGLHPMPAQDQRQDPDADHGDDKYRYEPVIHQPMQRSLHAPFLPFQIEKTDSAVLPPSSPQKV